MAERLPICLAAPLFVILALWGCKGESKPQAPVPTGGGAPAAASGTSTGNHPPAVRSARIFPSKAMIEMELRIEVQGEDMDGDRKSTRLNSSHGYISYAVFCLKKKN